MSGEELLSATRKHLWAAWQLSSEELASQAAQTLLGLGMLVPEGGAQELARLRDRVAVLEKRLHDAAMTRTWRLENGKKFVYVEDIAPALLGLEPRPDAITRRIAPVQALRDLTVDGEHYALVHHVYRTPRDLPEPGGQR